MHTEYIIPIFIYFVIPIIGLIFYIKLCIEMHKEIKLPPYIGLFLIFLIYGDMLQIIFTALFWKWSGLASIGTLFLILIAPILLPCTGLLYQKQKDSSIYHKCVYILSVNYIFIFIGIMVYMFLLSSYLTSNK